MTKTQNTMADMLEGDEDFLSQLNTAITTANQQAKKRAESSKYARKFRMPEEPEPDNTRKIVIRFITPYNKGTKVLEHGKFGSFQTVCPRTYGKDCQYCNMTDDQKAKQKISTKWIFLWQVWNYAANDGKGGPELFAFPINGASPVPPIHQLLKQEAEDAQEEGRPPNELTDFDLILVQSGEEAKRTFTPMKKAAKAAKFTIPAMWSEQHLKDCYTYIVSKDLLDLGEEQDATLEKDDDLLSALNKE